MDITFLLLTMLFAVSLAAIAAVTATRG